MKIKSIVLTVVILIMMLLGVSFSACSDNAQTYVQQLNYTESTAKINNPDQGFYRPIYVKMTENDVSYNKNIITAATQLYHLRVDISAFSKAVNDVADKPLSQAALDGLDGLLSAIKFADKNAIVRFAYDPGYNGTKDKEPSLTTMLNHVEQICAVINRYQNTITAIEVGLIGPWGEMHSSAVANADNINPLIDSFLTNTDAIPVLVRTPKMIYNYLGIKIDDIDDYAISASHKAYRLGLFNDGYLGSANDLGTYTDRQREVAFLSKQTGHLPYGGEVVAPSSTLHDIDKCLSEMYELNLSYLNVEWNNQVIDKWKSTYYTQSCGTDAHYYGATGFDYIQNRLGYRLVLTNSVFKYAPSADKLQIDLNINNVGFGNLNRVKRAKILITDVNGQMVVEQDVADFNGNETYACSLNLNLPNGDYNVYLRIYGDELDGSALYCVQFANDGLWNADLKSNKIGSFTVSENV